MALGVVLLTLSASFGSSLAADVGDEAAASLDSFSVDDMIISGSMRCVVLLLLLLLDDWSFISTDLVVSADEFSKSSGSFSNDSFWFFFVL